MEDDSQGRVLDEVMGTSWRRGRSDLRDREEAERQPGDWPSVALDSYF